MSRRTCPIFPAPAHSFFAFYTTFEKLRWNVPVLSMASLSYDRITIAGKDWSSQNELNRIEMVTHSTRPLGSGGIKGLSGRLVYQPFAGFLAIRKYGLPHPLRRGVQWLSGLSVAGC